MNFKCEGQLIWQTWSNKWGSWDKWFPAGVQRHIREESFRNSQRPEADRAVMIQLEKSHAKKIEPVSHVL